jgi:O-antigen/teichoic acid export membrane protein
MAGKTTVRSLGIVSTLILVRILGPEDFGIMALAMMVMGLFIVLSDVGINRYLILFDNPSKQDYDSAWTLNILLRLVILILVLFTSSYIAGFMGSSDLGFVLNVVAIFGFIGAFQSVDLIRLERNIDFKINNQIAVIAKVFAVILTVSCAFYYQSYMALLIGNGVSTMIMLALSYYFTGYRPTFRFTFDQQLFSFSSLLMLRNIVGFCRSTIDSLVVGKKFGEASLGEFNISRQFAILPLTEVIGPAMQPAFSAFSAIKDDRDKFKEKVYQSLFLIYSFIGPCSIGLYLLAEPFVLTVLGEKWQASIGYIDTLGFLMFPFATQLILHNLYDAFGKAKFSMLTDLYGLVCIALFVAMVSVPSVDFFIDVRVLIGLSSVLVSFVLAHLITGLSCQKILGLALVPISCSLLLLVFLQHFLLIFEAHYLTLLVNTLLGAIVYGLVYLSLCKALMCMPKAKWIMGLLPQPLYNFIHRGPLA